MVAASVEGGGSGSGGGERSLGSPGPSRKRRLSPSSPTQSHYLRNSGNHAPKPKDLKTMKSSLRESKGGGVMGRNVRISVCANQGGRKYMEDRVHIHCQRDSDGLLDYIYVAVYDGHGGAEASIFAKKHLLETIVEQRGFDSGTDEGILEAIRDGFLHTHEAMTKVVDRWPRTASGFRSTSGTTASVAFIRNGKIYTGHVGDSEIVLGLQNPNDPEGMVGEQVTIDHKPDCPRELRRIEGSGGEVMCKAGVMRVVWTRPVRGHVGPVRRSTPQEKIPFLAVARALGDLWSYNEDFDQYVVSPDPDMKVVELGERHKFMVLGSDGLSNVIKHQNCVDIVNAHEWKELREQGNPNSLLDRKCHPNHSRWLIRSALRGWGSLRADNISVITVIFDPPEAQIPDDHESVLQSGPDLDIEAILTHSPDAMIRITPRTLQLVYCGAVDVPLSYPRLNGITTTTAQVTTLSYTGPGFSSYSKEVVVRRQSSAPGPKSRVSLSSTPLQKTVSLGNGDYYSSESSELENEAEEEEEGTKKSSDGGTPKTRTFYCTKHGLTCEKVKKLNQAAASKNPEKLKALLDKTKVKNRQDVPRTEGPEERRTPGVGTGTKPKYFCRKHGLSCAKVKRMNQEYVRKQLTGEDGEKSPGGTVTVDDSDSSPEEKRETAAPKKAKNPLRPHTSARKSIQPRTMTNYGSAKKAVQTPEGKEKKYKRRTRAGTHLSPSRSVPSLRSLRSADRKRTGRHSVPRRLSLPLKSGEETPENGYQSIRSRLNSLRDDVRRSAHLFRVRKLRYCLRQSPAAPSPPSPAPRASQRKRAQGPSTRASFPPSTRTPAPKGSQISGRAERRTSQRQSGDRPVSVMSDSVGDCRGRPPSSSSPSAAGLIFGRGASAAQARRDSLRSSQGIEGKTKEDPRPASRTLTPDSQSCGRRLSSVSGSTTSQLKRSPIHPDSEGAERRNGMVKGVDGSCLGGVKRKLSGTDETGEEATESSFVGGGPHEPQRKRKKYWLANLFSVFRMGGEDGKR